MTPYNFVEKMSYSCGGGMNGSTLTQLRAEYEESMERLKDEKRELVMKISAAITEKKRAEQRSCDLEDKLSLANDELSSAKLALQRANYRQLEDSNKYNNNNNMNSDTMSEASFCMTDCSSRSSLTAAVTKRALSTIRDFVDSDAMEKEPKETIGRAIKHQATEENRKQNVLQESTANNEVGISSSSGTGIAKSPKEQRKKLQHLSPARSASKDLKALAKYSKNDNAFVQRSQDKDAQSKYKQS